jgi:AraC-like DNA-binding protein
MATDDQDPGADPARVRALMAELALSGPLSIERVARHLGTSPRTLQRHLSGRSLTFRTIVDETRLEIARVLLCKTDLRVQEIAARTGYRTPGSFARAFGRWTGRSPRAYRSACRCAGHN